MTNDNDAKIKRIFCDELGLDEGAVNDGTAYDSTDAWDSLKHLQLVGRLEEEFGIEISVDDIVAMSTFLKVKEIVNKNIAGKGAS
jgi:acyl carrier protein